MNTIKSQHAIVFVPGLGGDIRKTEFAATFWSGFTPIVFNMQWRDGKDYAPKHKRLLKLVDAALAVGKVSLVGMSAGGSAVSNIFIERKEQLTAMINICGRLRRGPHTGFRSFESKTKTSRAFRQSVEQFEDTEHLLDIKDRAKILTVHSLADELVPASTTIIDGATNIIVPSIEHGLSIAMATTLFVGPILRFLRNSEEQYNLQ